MRWFPNRWKGNVVIVIAYQATMSDGTVKVCFKRKDALSAPSTDIHISMDGKRLGSIKVNGTAYFDVSEGKHTVEFSVTGGLRTSGEVDLKEGTTVRIDFKLGKILFKTSRSSPTGARRVFSSGRGSSTQSSSGLRRTKRRPRRYPRCDGRGAPPI